MADLDVSVSESITLVDYIGYYADMVFLDEAVTVAVIPHADLNASVADNVSLTEATTAAVVAFSDLSVSAEENITAADSLSGDYADTVYVTEDFRLFVITPGVSLNLSVTMDDFSYWAQGVKVAG